MRKKGVVILESNVAVLAELKEGFEKTEDFQVLYSGDDGDEGVKQVLQKKPDVVVVGLFLKGTDGCGVMEAVKKTWCGTKMIATGLANDLLIEKAITFGADYYLAKPFSTDAAIERVRELMRESVVGEKKEFLGKRKPVTTDE